ncbi:MAG: PIN domain-containing protein [Spirochaetes bacterium]|jgi:predicted nucleic acid-binding protein|nr:PIN domain-containing protein [Spirochaetota bacterium]
MRAVLVDSSVVLDLFTEDPVFCDRSVAELARWGATHELAINDIVYAEVSVGFSRIEDLEAALFGAGFLRISMPTTALFLAAKAFAAYRRRGGAKQAILPDFFIGAHAAVTEMSLLTRDVARVRTAYPSVSTIEP